MRILSSAGAAALGSATPPLAALVEMDLASGPLYLCTAGADLVAAGTTYLGLGGLGRIDTVADSPAELKPLAFELSGVPATQIALALTEPVQGRPVRVKLALFDPDSFALLDVDLRWAGRLDVMNIADGSPAALLQVSAEHAGVDLLRPTASLYTDAEQQRLAPGDTGLQYLADQVDMRIVWPAASFFRQ